MTSPYLSELYAPVDTEVSQALLPIQGELPRDLRLLYACNSSNPRFTPEGKYHWFDGDGMVHAVAMRDGQVSYHSRWIRTVAYDADCQASRSTRRGILEPFDARDATPERDTSNTDLVYHAGKLLSLWWLGGQPYRLSVPTLETLGPETFGGKLTTSGMAAHPKVDTATGEMMFMDFSPHRAPYLHYGVVSKQGVLEHFVPIEIPGPSLFHDMAITSRFSILMDFPLRWDTDKLATGKRRVTFDAQRPTRFGVIPRRGDAPRWFEAKPCYMFHCINAHEEGQSLVVRGCRIDQPLPTQASMQNTRVPKLDFLELNPMLYEWRLDLTTGAVTERQLDDIPTEFPRINDAWRGQAQRYSYHCHLAENPTLLFDGIVKYDLPAAKATTLRLPPGHYCSEPTFVPRGLEEDDGYLATFVTSRAGSSEFCLFDARSLSAEPVARVALPRRLPILFHSNTAPLS